MAECKHRRTRLDKDGSQWTCLGCGKVWVAKELYTSKWTEEEYRKLERRVVELENRMSAAFGAIEMLARR